MQQSEIIVKYITDKYDSEPEKKRVKFSSLKWKTLILLIQGSVKEYLKIYKYYPYGL